MNNFEMNLQKKEKIHKISTKNENKMNFNQKIIWWIEKIFPVDLKSIILLKIENLPFFVC
jgi:hypothetical protein